MADASDPFFETEERVLVGLRNAIASEAATVRRSLFTGKMDKYTAIYSLDATQRRVLVDSRMLSVAGAHEIALFLHQYFRPLYDLASPPAYGIAPAAGASARVC